MPTIRLETTIAAPVQRCFDLARDVDMHTQSVAQTNERAVGGVTEGLLGSGDVVTWEATHFGIRQHLTVKITAFDAPHRFVDELVRGIFTELKHTHEFQPTEHGTLMVDTFYYRSPLGLLGTIADKLFLERYMRRFLMQRNLHLKAIAEAQDARLGTA